MAATHHLIDKRVVNALGPDGFIVNIARSPVIDEQALVAALAADKLAGAALDVFEHEPAIPEALIGDRRLVLTPHIGSGTEETRRAMAKNRGSAGAALLHQRTAEQGGQRAGARKRELSAIGEQTRAALLSTTAKILRVTREADAPRANLPACPSPRNEFPCLFIPKCNATIDACIRWRVSRRGRHEPQSPQRPRTHRSKRPR
ncbi:NAD(P)-dependent oxidoreductase [Caballeronia sp. LZ019]|uniref:NAD(P)-dependent oxidoreductase n=1 Tax=Caballeronia sp. LZ019 TaxID=3038555 RepID=UPI002860B1DC|nr:NAD(P)-dependent oxidoreductase [Caballeronia sp. LZ019]MDR5809208.1 NAD(P)-dependent oxidoreductase [Caballeronia sp. LZ019]